MDRHGPGPVSSWERGSFRHRNHAGRQRVLLRPGRYEHYFGGEMTEPKKEKLRFSRRRFLSSGLVVAAGASLQGQVAPSVAGEKGQENAGEPFWGQHQSGILTPQQKHTYIAVFDLVTT